LNFHSSLVSEREKASLAVVGFTRTKKKGGFAKINWFRKKKKPIQVENQILQPV
jgi:hypothetical protein